MAYLMLVLGVKPWDKQIAIAQALVEAPYKVLVRSCHNVGKCMGQDELLPLPDGRRVPVRELVGRPFDLLTLVDGIAVPVTARAAWNAVEPVYRVTTETSRQIVRNGQHPLWTADEVRGTGVRHQVNRPRWEPVSALKAGDIVAVADGLPCFGTKQMLDDEVKILAYLIGDGGITKSTPTFTQLPGKQLNEFRTCCHRLGSMLVPVKNDPITYRVVGSDSKSKRVAYYEAGNASSHRINPVIDLIRMHDLDGKHSRNKRISPLVMQLDKRQQRLFVNRLFATDGWACVDKNGRAEIGYCSVSEGLARDVQEMLLRFGVHGSIRHRTDVDAWCIEVHDREDSLRFCDRIGIYGKEEAVRKVRKRLGNAKKVRRWRYLNAHPGTRWERIRSIELLPDQPTVAIEVPGHHTYLTALWEHNTWLAAALTSWWFDTHQEDSCVITTAPTAREVSDLLWSEIRRQRREAGLESPYPGAKAPEMWANESHFAKGFTAAKGESFQGRHYRHMLFLFDESVGIDGLFWETAKSMFKGDGNHAWLCTHNPTDTSSIAYQEERTMDLDGQPAWTTIAMSAFEHPNVVAELAGKPPPYPSAVGLSQVDSWVADWCEAIVPGEIDDEQGDFEWRPGSGRWYRPGPLMESRGMGKWPRQGLFGVWSEAAWDRTLALREWVPDLLTLPVVGCDLGFEGEDFTEIHVRWGGHSLSHERYNGWTEERTVGRLKVLCGELAVMVNRLFLPGRVQVRPEEIPVNYDSDGRGKSLTNEVFTGAFKFVPVSAASQAREVHRFPNKRSEMWFNTVRLARQGLVNISRLPRDIQARLRQQAMAPKWSTNASGKQEVEKKKETKKRLKQSPDGMDAMNLAYYGIVLWESATSIPNPPAPSAKDRDPGFRWSDPEMGKGRRRLFGGGR